MPHEGIQSEKEARATMRSLIRTRSLMVQLELKKMTILTRSSILVIRHLRTSKSIEPLLQSVRSTEGLESLS